MKFKEDRPFANPGSRLRKAVQDASGLSGVPRLRRRDHNQHREKARAVLFSERNRAGLALRTDREPSIHRQAPNLTESESRILGVWDP
jgi:hypothetical protein